MTPILTRVRYITRRMPKFSVIMPSYLGEYGHAAKDRDKKIVRAINSVLTQKDFELLVMADDCQETVDIVAANFRGQENLYLYKLPKRKIKGKRNAGGAGIPRNAGLQRATGEYAIYLDIDDVYLDGYLESLAKNMDDHDWYWFNDLSWNKKTERFDAHKCDINEQGQCGTSNICHKISMGAWWSERVTYLHDWYFINTLKQLSDNYKFLSVGGYGICHVPGLLDV